MILHNNGLLIGWLLRGAVRAVTKKRFPPTGDPLTITKFLKSCHTQDDWKLSKIFHKSTKYSNKKPADIEIKPGSKKYEALGQQEGEGPKQPPKVSENCIVLRKTLSRQKKIFGFDNHSTNSVPNCFGNLSKAHFSTESKLPGCPNAVTPLRECPEPPPKKTETKSSAPKEDACSPSPKKEPEKPKSMCPAPTQRPKAQCPARSGGGSGRKCADPLPSKCAPDPSPSKCPPNPPVSKCPPTKVAEKSSPPSKCPEDPNKSRKCPPCTSDRNYSSYLPLPLLLAIPYRNYSCSRSGRRSDGKCRNPSSGDRKKIRKRQDEDHEQPAACGTKRCMMKREKMKRQRKSEDVSPKSKKK